MGLSINGVDVGNPPATNTNDNTRTNYTLIQVLQAQVDYILENVVIVNSKEDFPTPIAGVITLDDRVTYIVTTDVDLEGDRILTGLTNAIIGYSSENCSLTSTGLVGALITSTNTIALRQITFKDVTTCFDLDGNLSSMALDWIGVNLTNIPSIGTIKNFDNFIFSNGRILNSKGLILDGTCDTISISESLLSGDDLLGAIISIPSTAVINRRFRIIFSAVNVNLLTTGIDVDVNASILNEAYILDTVNFAGTGTYIAGIDSEGNKSMFRTCKGIRNTLVNGQVYMRNNATPTTIAVSGTFYKVLGTTLNSIDNSKVITSDNYIEIDAAIERKYRIDCTLSFNSIVNNVCSFGFYDSFLGDIRQPSIQSATAGAAGRAENVTFFCFANRKELDYFEIWCTNDTNTNDITVTDMNFSVTEIK